MSRARRSVLTGFLLTIVATGFLAGCGKDVEPPTGVQKPFRDEWRIEVDAEFPYIVDDAINISSISIGGLTTQDNFANRGDVIVKVDGPDDRILVEMRRFTWRTDEEEAATDYESTELLAYTGSLRTPDEIPDENKCGRRMEDDPDDFYPWQEGCGIRLYYKGQIQPSRLGADFRVTLPGNYRHDIAITTDDNDEVEDYLNRGDVCVQNLNGNVDAELESGLAYVLLDRDTTPGPKCPEEWIQNCEEWTEDGEPAPWGSECLCKDFGSAKVESSGAANITIDAPDHLWSTFSLDNQASNQTADEHCDANIDWPGAEIEESDDAWKQNGEANHPSEAAATGAGFSLRAVAAECMFVLYTDNPEEYVGETGVAEDQDGEDRGHLTLCNDCVAESTCEDLLTGS
jgi:hypothetical protein